MKITIAQKMRPFSHLPGCGALVPGSKFAAKTFADRIEFFDWSAPEPLFCGTLRLSGLGPVEQQTLIQDLEKGELTLFGHCASGYFRLCIYQALEGISLNILKAPDCFSFHWEGEESFFAKEVSERAIPIQERLFLGCSKKQDWEMVAQRLAVQELLPLWHLLGLQTPPFKEGAGKSLLAECRGSSRDNLFSALQDAFKAGFSQQGILLPRISDGGEWGYNMSSICAPSPLALLSEGAAFVRRLFCSLEGEDAIELLPQLPTQFPVGRMINVKLDPSLLIDIEWTKKKPRRMVLRGEGSRCVRLKLPKGIKECRVRTSSLDRGCCYTSLEPLEIVAGGKYEFDRFQS